MVKSGSIKASPENDDVHHAIIDEKVHMTTEGLVDPLSKIERLKEVNTALQMCLSEKVKELELLKTSIRNLL